MHAMDCWCMHGLLVHAWTAGACNGLLMHAMDCWCMQLTADAYNGLLVHTMDCWCMQWTADACMARSIE